MDLLLEPHMEAENAMAVCILVRQTRDAVTTEIFWPTILLMTLTQVTIQNINIITTAVRMTMIPRHAWPTGISSMQCKLMNGQLACLRADPKGKPNKPHPRPIL